MKKRVVLLVLTIFATATLTACGSNAPKVTVIGNSSNQEKTATQSGAK